MSETGRGAVGLPASREVARAAARAAADKQAERVVILDVHELIVITDLFVICSGSTDRQVKTIVEEVERVLRERLGRKPARREGTGEAAWVLLDYVDLVVHVFEDEARDYYDLERLWADAPRVDWGGDTTPASAGSGD
jgi:ribosome-associated protein